MSRTWREKLRTTTVKAALWSTNEAPSPQHNERNGTRSYSKKLFRLTEEFIILESDANKGKKKSHFQTNFLGNYRNYRTRES